MALLKDLSIGGKGNYGIGASAVDKRDDLYTYLRITDINDDGYIEILTAAVAFAQRTNSFYFNSFISLHNNYYMKLYLYSSRFNFSHFFKNLGVY